MQYSFEDVTKMVLKDEMSKAQGARVLGVPVSTFKDQLARLQNGNGHGPVYHDDGLSYDANPDEIPIFTIDHRDKEKLSLYPIGDVHKGAAQHLDDLFKEWLQYVAQELTILQLSLLAMVATQLFPVRRVILSKRRCL